MYLGTGGAERSILRFQQAAIGAQGHHGKGHAELRKELVRSLLRGAVPEELYLVIADFHYIRLMETPEHLLLGGLLGFP